MFKYEYLECATNWMIAKEIPLFNRSMVRQLGRA